MPDIVSVTYKRFKRLCKVVLDDGEELECALELVTKYALREGTTIKKNIIKKVLEDQRIYEIKQSAYRIATNQKRTFSQIKDKLRERQYTTEEIDAALSFLKEFKLIDDEQYADDFVRSYTKRKPSGKFKVQMELQKRGITKELAENTVNNFFTDKKTFNLARKAAYKKYNYIKTKPKEKHKTALCSFLQRQGFDFPLIETICEEVLEE